MKNINKADKANWENFLKETIEKVSKECNIKDDEFYQDGVVVHGGDFTIYMSDKAYSEYLKI
jgi:hypothetical protein